jgi:hypothetical protein
VSGSWPLHTTQIPVCVCVCCNCTLLSGFAVRYSSGIRYSVKCICVGYRFSSLILSGLPSGFNFRSADLLSAYVVIMSTVVPTKVSSAEMKLQQKVTEQREREDAKMLETRAKDAQKIVTKIQATKMGLDNMVSRADFATLPASVRSQLLHLFQKLEGIHECCTIIVQTEGSDEGEILSMQDTIHT